MWLFVQFQNFYFLNEKVVIDSINFQVGSSIEQSVRRILSNICCSRRVITTNRFVMLMLMMVVGASEILDIFTNRGRCGGNAVSGITR